MLLRWQMPLKFKMLMLELIAHALMPLMNTHASVFYKVAFDQGMHCLHKGYSIKI